MNIWYNENTKAQKSAASASTIFQAKKISIGK